MQIKTFRVPFAEIAGEEATELDFGPDDYLVVRPIFGLSRTELNAWQPRFNEVADVVPTPETPITPAGQKIIDKLTIDLIATTCLEWHLSDAEGKPIAKPTTSADLDRLPLPIVNGLIRFLSGYRGSGPNPTTPG